MGFKCPAVLPVLYATRVHLPAFAEGQVRHILNGSRVFIKPRFTTRFVQTLDPL